MNNILLYFKVFNKKIFKISNFNFIVILALICSSIILALTFMHFSIECSQNIKKSVSNREFVLIGDFDKSILDNNHIQFLGSDKYNLEAFYEVDNIYGNKAGITIKPILDSSVIHLIDGRKELAKNEMICSKKFYPYYLADYGKYSLIDSKKLVGKKISTDDREFTIVGTFSNIPFDSSDTCYVNVNTFEDLNLNSNGDTLVVLDDEKNISDFLKNLESNQIHYIKVLNVDNHILLMYFYIPLFVMLIILIIMINVIYFFIKKKNIKYFKLFGILKTCGYSMKKIILLNLTEYNILLVFVIPLSLIFYSAISYFIKKYLLYEFIYNNLYFNFSFLYFFVFVILLIVITNAMTIILLLRYLKKETNYLAGEDSD